VKLTRSKNHNRLLELENNAVNAVEVIVFIRPAA
jgi:hypothetical protein